MRANQGAHVRESRGSGGFSAEALRTPVSLPSPEIPRTSAPHHVRSDSRSAIPIATRSRLGLSRSAPLTLKMGTNEKRTAVQRKQFSHDTGVGSGIGPGTRRAQTILPVDAKQAPNSPCALSQAPRLAGAPRPITPPNVTRLGCRGSPRLPSKIGPTGWSRNVSPAKTSSMRIHFAIA
jgi:hypothetical protein